MAIRITGRKVKRSPDMDNIFVRSINITQLRNRVDSFEALDRRGNEALDARRVRDRRG